MKAALVVALAALAVSVGDARGEKVFPYPYQTKTLPNGLRIILIPLDSPGLISYYTIVRTGSRDEVEPGRTGFAHFFEHMMFRGTKRFPGPVYDRIVTGIGADANAYTTDDYTAFHLTFAKEDLPTVVDIESDRFQNLDYEQAAFQTEAGAVYGEYRKSVTQPFFMLEETMKNLAYDRHTYKHTTMGFEADIRAMPQAYEYSRAFFDRFYRPENTVLLIVGDLDVPQALTLIEKHYGPWKPGYKPAQIVAEPPQQESRSKTVRYPGKTLPVLDMAFKGAAFNPTDREYAAALLLEELAFGSNSEIVKKLVLQEQKVESLSADFPLNRDRPLFEIYAMVKSEQDLDYVRDEVLRTLTEFQSKPVDPGRLDQVKRRHKYSFLMGLDSSDAVAGGLARMVALTGGIEVVDQLFEQFDRVTPDDVMRAAKKFFTAERRTIVVLKGAEQ